jgi:hypothetical protein
VVIGGVEVLAPGPPATAAGARSTRTRSSFWRCNMVVDVGRVRQLLLRIAADIEELGSTTSAAGRRPSSRGYVCSFELRTGKPDLHRSGNCAPTSPTLRGAQMDLAPRP